tara:strand:+ start:354 stop:563 length:210 start_codon:yes stop_codon:yes gene_type:complete
MSGLKKLLNSQRAWAAIVAVIVCVAVEVFNVPEATAQVVTEKVVTLALALIGGISVSDLGMALKGNKTK